ncbi:GNAT family N-acetyltransferase [Streptomyces sp. NPDC001792]|uniref:GNAT family N-acetyltransferase n=1 Tax=Streptomyces sp. NPDC001792 TaxID=3154524 RepID=UPI00331E699E
MHLREITDDNRDAIRALRVRRDQKQFVASVSKSLKEAARKPEANPWSRAVYIGDEPVGFVMLSWKPPAGPYKGRHFIWRLLLDKRHPRRGIGRETLTRRTAHWRAGLIAAAGGCMPLCMIDLTCSRVFLRRPFCVLSSKTRWPLRV